MAERVGDLEVAQDLEFQRQEWRIQRVAWVMMALVLLAGLAGLLGSGPLAHASTEADGLTVAYDRIVRARAPIEVRFVLAPDLVSSGRAEIWIDRSMLDKADIQRIVPEPESEQAGADRVVFVVAATEPGALVEVAFGLEAHDPGGFAADAGIVDGPRVALSGFVLP